MLHIRAFLFVTGVGLLAMVPFVAAAQDSSSGMTGGIDAGVDLSAPAPGGPEAAVHDQGEGKGSERWERFRERLHELICGILEERAPSAYERVCTEGGADDVPPEPTATPTPIPEPTATPTPEPEPIPDGDATFAGEALVTRFASVGPGAEWGFAVVPGDTSPAGGDYAWPDGTYRVSLSRSAAGSVMLSWSGPGPGVFAMKTVAATCGAWDTMEVAIFDGSGGVTGQLQNVVVNGVALGTLADNGDAVPENDFWTFAGAFGDFSMTFDLAVTGWGTPLANPARIEITVGCGA